MGRPRSRTTARQMCELGHAKGDVAGVGGDAKGELAAGLDDDGERAGPEALGEAVEGAVQRAGEFVGLRVILDKQRERLVARAGLEVVDAVDGAEVHGIDGEAVEGVGGKRDHLAGFERVNNAQHKVRFRLFRMNAKHLSDQGCEKSPRH